MLDENLICLPSLAVSSSPLPATVMRLPAVLCLAAAFFVVAPARAATESVYLEELT